MKSLYYGFIMIVCIVLTSCSSSGGTNDKKQGYNSHNEAITTQAEVREGDFIYRLVSEQGTYEGNDSVMMYAELEYIGEKSEVTIFHSASPFNFPIVEKTRDYAIPYVMNEPLLNTTLIHGEPLREKYGRSGGYGSNDEEGYVKFMKSFLKDGFPSGYYIVDGFADFYIESDKGKTDYTIKAQIQFAVDRGKQ
jgi:hypothetical protein